MWLSLCGSYGHCEGLSGGNQGWRVKCLASIAQSHSPIVVMQLILNTMQDQGQYHGRLKKSMTTCTLSECRWIENIIPSQQHHIPVPCNSMHHD